MPRKRSNRNNINRNVRRPRNGNVSRVANMLLPGPNQGSVHLARSDLTPRIVKMLSPFNTVGNRTYSLRQPYSIGSISQVANVNTFAAYYFALSGLDNLTALGAVFDQYRILCVEVSVRPRTTQTTFADSANLFPRLYSVIDYDDAVPLTTIGQAREYDSCIESSPGEGIVRTFIPAMSLAAYSGAFTSYAQKTLQWLDIASPTIQHFGLKLALEAGFVGQTNLQTYDIDAVVFLQFKSVR